MNAALGGIVAAPGRNMWLQLAYIILLTKYCETADDSRDVAAGAEMGLLPADMWILVPT
jgi:hypothetical protein